MQMPSSGSGRRNYAFTEINVTPFVDVMLVLLIVFMVSAPLMVSGMDIDLPSEPTSAVDTDNVEPLTINIDSSGSIFIQDVTTPIEKLDLSAKLEAIVRSNPETRVVVKADKGLTYQAIMEVLAAVGASGITKVALLSEQK